MFTDIKGFMVWVYIKFEGVCSVRQTWSAVAQALRMVVEILFLVSSVIVRNETIADKTKKRLEQQPGALPAAAGARNAQKINFKNSLICNL